MPPTSPTCSVTPPTVPSGRRTGGPATHISPSRRDCITLTESLSTKNGWPTIATNSNPTGCCRPSSPPAAGDTNGQTGLTGQAPSPSSHGTSISTAHPIVGVVLRQHQTVANLSMTLSFRADRLGTWRMGARKIGKFRSIPPAPISTSMR